MPSCLPSPIILPTPLEINNTMATLTDRIFAAADTHASLLSQMADLEHAPFTLEQQQLYLDDLKETLTSLKKELEDLRTVTSKERKLHQDLRDSFARRYAHKLTGRSDKFVSMIEKEEREFLDALQTQRAAEAKEKYLEETIAETEARVKELSVQNTQYEALREQAKQLYKQVFQGPTLEFPEEDQMEVAVQNAKEGFAEAQARYDADVEAEKILKKAERIVGKAFDFCQNALGASTFDLWGGGQVADLMERDSLSRAQACLSQAQMLLTQAVGLQSLIGPFPEVAVTQGHVLGDVIFDNPLSDYKFREKVLGTNMEMHKLHRAVKIELQRQKLRALDAKNELGNAKTQLAAARAELDKVRREVFEEVTGIKCVMGIPPAYDAMDSPPPPPLLPEIENTA
ncbi:hypothetical protein ABW19_dt0203275 [Dactylella cylindrospora]|nr:hypothetical protein ABW19_dt0203275 [Dactylella cylindrospora]